MLFGALSLWPMGKKNTAYSDGWAYWEFYETSDLRRRDRTPEFCGDKVARLRLYAANARTDGLRSLARADALRAALIEAEAESQNGHDGDGHDNGGGA